MVEACDCRASHPFMSDYCTFAAALCVCPPSPMCGFILYSRVTVHVHMLCVFAFVPACRCDVERRAIASNVRPRPDDRLALAHCIIYAARICLPAHGRIRCGIVEECVVRHGKRTWARKALCSLSSQTIMMYYIHKTASLTQPGDVRDAERHDMRARAHTGRRRGQAWTHSRSHMAAM